MLHRKLNFFKPLNPNLNKLKPRKKILILGSGWAGYSLAKSIDKFLYDVTILSPRNHFLFTPLLTTTTVGTLEFRNITESVRDIKNVNYIQADCTAITPSKNSVQYKSVFSDYSNSCSYDLLVIATGATSNTFNVKGVYENCFFLKQLIDARKIRNRISKVFEMASLPGITIEKQKQLLTFVIVGAGPASIEFAAELHDFLTQDSIKHYPNLYSLIQIYLIEATSKILGMFDTHFQDYTLDLYKERNIDILTNTSVKRVNKDSIELSNGRVIKTGTVLWNTGNTITPFVKSLGLDLFRGRIKTDEYYRVRGLKKGKEEIKNVFSIGDCSVNENNFLPQTAQVAQQQGDWLSKNINLYGLSNHAQLEYSKFKYKHRGTLAYVGEWRALVDVKNYGVKGVIGWIFWNLVYLSKLISMKNKILVPFHWGCSWLFGRNITRF